MIMFPIEVKSKILSCEDIGVIEDGENALFSIVRLPPENMLRTEIAEQP